MLKVSAFYLDRQKSFVPKNKCGMLVIETLKQKISDFLNSNTCQCSQLDCNSNSVHYLIQIHAHNCQHLNLSPKQYLHYNITQQTKTEIFQVSYNMLLAQCAKLLWYTVATTFCDLLFSSLKQIFDRKIELILFCHIDKYHLSINFSQK